MCLVDPALHWPISWWRTFLTKRVPPIHRPSTESVFFGVTIFIWFFFPLSSCFFLSRANGFPRASNNRSRTREHSLGNLDKFLGWGWEEEVFSSGINFCFLLFVFFYLWVECWIRRTCWAPIIAANGFGWRATASAGGGPGIRAAFGLRTLETFPSCCQTVGNNQKTISIWWMASNQRKRKNNKGNYVQPLMYVWIVLPDLCVQFALDIQVTGDESLVDLRREVKQNKSEQQKKKKKRKMRCHWTSSYDRRRGARSWDRSSKKKKRNFVFF